MRLSIIVPVYNMERWLLRCLKSLYSQNLSEKEFEIIIVNDGSTDNSEALASSFASEHSNVRIINRENGGLSAARNTGLDHAIGRYVWFVDSDDYIEPNSIKPILEFAENNDLDVMGFFFQLAYEDGRTIQYFYTPKFPNTVFSGPDFLCKTYFMMSPWACLYKRSFLEKNSLRYKEGILHEDEEFSPRVQFLAKRIAHSNEIVYNYSQREGSIMKSSRDAQRVESFLTICDSLYEFMISHNVSETSARNFFRNKLLFCYSQGLSYLSRIKAMNIKKFKNKSYYPLNMPEELTAKLKMKYTLLNNSLWLYVKLLQISNLITKRDSILKHSCL